MEQITEHVNKIGNPYVQSYLVQGKVCALVEAGVSSSAVQMVEQLAKMGFPPGDLRYLIIPHVHFDHVCGIPVLQRAFPNIQVLASETAARVMTKEKVLRGFFNEDKILADKLGLPYPEAAVPLSIEVHRTVQDGEELNLGNGCLLKFHMAPGHSPCSMAVSLAKDGVLFPSDCAGYPITRQDIFPMYFANYRDYLVSLDSLLNIGTSVLAAPHELLLHGKDEIKAYFKDSLETTRAVHSYICDEAKKGSSPEEISGELYKRFCRGGLLNYTEENIRLCMDLLVRRSLEA